MKIRREFLAIPEDMKSLRVVYPVLIVSILDVFPVLSSKLSNKWLLKRTLSKSYNRAPNGIIEWLFPKRKKVLHVLNHIHVYTPTHLGPYCVGMLLGYVLSRSKECKLNRSLVVLAWCCSLTVGLSSVLGLHRFSTGAESSRALAVLYAALHRSAFTCAVAWVLYACISGLGGPVNAFLSCASLAPFSRLSFMVYLLHPLVIWTRLGSLRERIATTHYDFMYEYLTNLVISFCAAVPFYLLLEAPLSNLDRMLNFRRPEKENHPSEKEAPVAK
ncbi:nose resistant to fluoxetine protein 6 [Nephila pilipes]|uniref:Nose resistant to fluoxetine protein 6 n=1 Tax=Nephila pilipes TaxID=299642 RepID=A0A8X6N5V4_NEPPI|nr:nose resistant to fluoxetine protein 6 [Nephila pilipes]